VARRLVAAEEARRAGTYALQLRALAVAHAPKSVLAIDRALKAAQQVSCPTRPAY
jgi:hypothetical protein